uniref:Uncharacterized protein n=1 Tax=Rhodosorus marinus TaxID=101924 RepID=A0A7S3A0H7_9RHOD|mmetsp:Transcript_3838/g.16598  ORF Transcript_3838/g.16598 Transcript_3838/m.16598 type:complete len:242 (+) Transcript_3838:401-1126(+)
MKEGVKDHSLFLCLLVLAGAVAAREGSDCAIGGKCFEIKGGFVNIVEGPECRKFFATGLCSRLCLQSLEAITSRTSWSKCALRCNWGSTITKGAVSWLELCRRHAAREAPANPHTKREVKEEEGIVGEERHKPATTKEFRQAVKTLWLKDKKFAVPVLAGLCAVLVAVLVLRVVRIGEQQRTLYESIQAWFRNRRLDRRIRTRRKQGLDKVLDPGSDYRIREATGRARRHLIKAISPQHAE